MAAGEQVGGVDGHEAQINNPRELYCLEVLQLIKDAQQTHGLRHGDYQRYRQYCSRKLRRIRKSLHFPQGGKYKVQPKRVTKEHLNDIRFLYVPLFLAERAWAYAVQLKSESNTEPRKRPHLMARLKKAVFHADELLVLCESDKCDARTKLEAQAYAAFIKGNVYFEKESWKQAIELFTSAKTVYEKLASALVDEVKDVYIQRCDEITPNIRYCAYNIGDDSAVQDLLDIRFKSGGTDSMTSKLDELIDKTRQRQAATLSEVTWRGRTVPVKSEEVRVCLLSVMELSKQLDESQDNDGKLSVYESVLKELIDAQQALKDELKDDPVFKQLLRGKQTDTRVPNSVYLHTYLAYMKLTKTVDRHLLMIETLKANLPGIRQDDSKKVTKPQDLARLYDLIIQSLGEVSSLSGLEDETLLIQEMSALCLAYKTYRCYYVAQTYAAARKWKETLALYERILTYAEQATNAVKASKMETLRKNLELDRLKQIVNDVDGEKYSCHASSILDSETASSADTKKVVRSNKILEERLEEYYEDPILNNPKKQTQAVLTHFPPDFQPVPCKPLFFDVALSKVSFPSLEDKLEQKKSQPSGITGLVKGWLWGGGKK